jgi:hypothetical protein
MIGREHDPITMQAKGLKISRFSSSTLAAFLCRGRCRRPTWRSRRRIDELRLEFPFAAGGS